MRVNKALSTLQRDQVTVGPFLTVGSPDLAELTAHAGFDYVFLDWQHGEWTESTLNNALARFLATDCAPIVRVKGIEPGTINRVLDMGALGVIVPMVETAEQARLAASVMRFPPMGQRSGGGNRLSLLNGTSPGGYFKNASDEMLLVVMVESQAAIERADEIAAVPGVDVVLVGPGDLLLDVQSRGGDHTDLERLVERLPDIVRGAGKTAGYICANVEAIQLRMSQGYRFITYQSDVGVLLSAWQETVARIATL